MIQTKHGKFSYIGSVNSSSKIIKGKKKNVATYIVYLAPEKLSGNNVCKFSTKGCREACLFTSGRAKVFGRINEARLLKTKMYFEEPQRFMEILFKEIESAYKLWTKKGFEFAVRFNGTSDEDITNLHGYNLPEKYPHIQFYDYTKNPKAESKHSNYHLTYSYSGENEHLWDVVSNKINVGINAAMVFFPAIPEEYKGFKVINGDETDLRYKDEKNVIVGLKYKRTKQDSLEKIYNNKFIIKYDKRTENTAI